MQLIIELKGNSISIKQGKNELYKGRREAFSGEAYFSLTNINDKPAITINEYKNFLKKSYDIITYSPIRKEYNLTSKSLLKGYWIIEDENIRYDIISHPGPKISIFKNEEQVASLSERSVNLFNTKLIILNCNQEEKVELLTGVAIAMFGSFYSNAGATVIFNFGHLGPQVRKFNKDWKPN